MIEDVDQYHPKEEPCSPPYLLTVNETRGFLCVVKYQKTHIPSIYKSTFNEFHKGFWNIDQLFQWDSDKRISISSAQKLTEWRYFIKGTRNSDFNIKTYTRYERNLFKGIRIIIVKISEVPKRYSIYAPNFCVDTKTVIKFYRALTMPSNTYGNAVGDIKND